MFNYLIEIIIFIFGMCVGSFANVCIYRLPLSKSIIDPPRSFCPNCKAMIRFYDNIPVLSYLWLKARCRHCSQPIPFRYPLVEIICGSFALSAFLKFGLSFECLIYFAFITSLIIITFIDIDHQIIPDVITLPGIPVCFLASFVLPSLTYKDSLLGLLAGGGSLLIVGWIYYLIKKVEGMGGGDIKLLAMIGAILGWKGVLSTVFIASLTGTLVGIIIIMRTQKDMKVPVPFGPFLSIGAIIYIFFGPDLINWYFGLLR